MAITLAFEMPDPRGGGPGAWLLGHSHFLPRIALAVALATLVFGGRRLIDELRAMAGPMRGPGRWWAYLLGHLITLATFAATTAALPSGRDRLAAHSGWWARTGWRRGGGTSDTTCRS